MSYQKIATYKKYKGISGRLIQEFGHLKTNEITKQQIQRFASKLSEDMTPPSVKIYLGVLKGIIEYADDDWVMPRIKVPKRSKPRQEIYTWEEARKIIRFLTGQDKVLVCLLAETGCRIGEALALQSKDVQGDILDINKNLHYTAVYDPKTSNSFRKVVLSPRLCYLLKSIVKQDPEGFVFRNKHGRAMAEQMFRIRMQKACKMAGIDWRGFHAFRRGNITELIINVLVPEKIVGYRVGHESGGITLGIYCQVREGCDKPWIEKIEQTLWISETSET